MAFRKAALGALALGSTVLAGDAEVCWVDDGQIVTTHYSTRTYTVNSCAPTVKNCPARSTEVFSVVYTNVESHPATVTTTKTVYQTVPGVPVGAYPTEWKPVASPYGGNRGFPAPAWVPFGEDSTPDLSQERTNGRSLLGTDEAPTYDDWLGGGLPFDNTTMGSNGTSDGDWRSLYPGYPSGDKSKSGSGSGSGWDSNNGILSPPASPSKSKSSTTENRPLPVPTSSASSATWSSYEGWSASSAVSSAVSSAASTITSPSQSLATADPAKCPTCTGSTWAANSTTVLSKTASSSNTWAWPGTGIWSWGSSRVWGANSSTTSTTATSITSAPVDPSTWTSDAVATSTSVDPAAPSSLDSMPIATVSASTTSTSTSTSTESAWTGTWTGSWTSVSTEPAAGSPTPIHGNATITESGNWATDSIGPFTSPTSSWLLTGPATSDPAMTGPTPIFSNSTAIETSSWTSTEATTVVDPSVATSTSTSESVTSDPSTPSTDVSSPIYSNSTEISNSTVTSTSMTSDPSTSTPADPTSAIEPGLYVNTTSSTTDSATTSPSEPTSTVATVSNSTTSMPVTSDSTDPTSSTSVLFSNSSAPITSESSTATPALSGSILTPNVTSSEPATANATSTVDTTSEATVEATTTPFLNTTSSSVDPATTSGLFVNTTSVVDPSTTAVPYSNDTTVSDTPMNTTASVTEPAATSTPFLNTTTSEMPVSTDAPTLANATTSSVPVADNTTTTDLASSTPALFVNTTSSISEAANTTSTDLASSSTPLFENTTTSTQGYSLPASNNNTYPTATDSVPAFNTSAPVYYNSSEPTFTEPPMFNASVPANATAGPSITDPAVFVNSTSPVFLNTSMPAPTDTPVVSNSSSMVITSAPAMNTSVPVFANTTDPTLTTSSPIVANTTTAFVNTTAPVITDAPLTNSSMPFANATVTSAPTMDTSVPSMNATITSAPAMNMSMPYSNSTEDFKTSMPAFNASSPFTNGTYPEFNSSSPINNGSAPFANGTEPTGTYPMLNSTEPVYTNASSPMITSSPTSNSSDPVANATITSAPFFNSSSTVFDNSSMPATTMDNSTASAFNTSTPLFSNTTAPATDNGTFPTTTSAPAFNTSSPIFANTTTTASNATITDAPFFSNTTASNATVTSAPAFNTSAPLFANTTTTAADNSSITSTSSFAPLNTTSPVVTNATANATAAAPPSSNSTSIPVSNSTSNATFPAFSNSTNATQPSFGGNFTQPGQFNQSFLCSGNFSNFNGSFLQGPGQNGSFSFDPSVCYNASNVPAFNNTNTTIVYPLNKICGEAPYNAMPNTGVTRKYQLDVSVMTLAPDGVEKEMIVVNGQFPGPLIEANWGDWVEITVTNHLPQEGTTMHWHGIRQRGTQWEDGVPFTGQCPIVPGKSQTYLWRADSYGTSWYHSHYSAQYSGGTFGPIIIHGPEKTYADYDVDLGPIMLSDWYHDKYQTLVKETMTTVSGRPPASNNNLINGKMNYPCANTDKKCTPNAGLSKFTFTSGKKYRLRLINTSSDGMEKFTIDGHIMTIIAIDFMPVKPYKTNMVNVAVGQRFDVIVEATGKPTDKYWMRASLGPGGLASCSNFDGISPDAYAIVYYDKADKTSMPNTQSSITDAQFYNCNDLPLEALDNVCPVTAVTTSGSTIKRWDVHIDIVNNGTNFVWRMNNSTFRADYNTAMLQEVNKLGQPAASSKTNSNKNNFNSGSNFNSGTNSNRNGRSKRQNFGNQQSSNFNRPAPVDPNALPAFKPEWNIYNSGEADYVQIVVYNIIPFTTHPMHLHGHDAQILAEGFGEWDGTITKPNNPVRRDTFTLQRAKDFNTPAYTVLQFETDNPGVWPFHCHFAWHSSGGMDINILEKPNEIKKLTIPQKNFQTCTDWNAYTAGGYIPDQIDSGL